MKLYLPLLLLTSFFVSGQNNIRLIYEFWDYGGYQDELVLLIKDNKSVFEFHKDPLTITDENEWQFHHYFEHYENYYDFTNKKITEMRLMDDKEHTEVIAQWQSDIKWEITDETQEINGYLTQKAVCQSYNTDGRGDWDYGNAIAWFTMDIPIGTGPERYYGLPGLIVLLEFSLRKSKRFQLKEINYDDAMKAIKFPTKGIQVSKTEILMPSKISKGWLKKQKKEFQQ